MLLILPLVLLIHLVLLLNTRFTLWPEMVVYPYLVNSGFSLYRDIINPYMPAFIYFLALLEKISQSKLIYFQAFTWIVILAVDIVIFTIAKRLTAKTKDALTAVSFFIIFSIPFSVNNLWFDLIQTPFVLLSVYFFYRFQKEPSDKKSLFYSSIFTTIAFFIKQQAIWLVIYFMLVLIFRFGKRSLALVLSEPKIFAPPAVLVILHLLFFAKNGLLPDFLFWTTYFPYFLTSSLPGYVLLPNLKQVLPVVALILASSPLLLSKNDLKFFVITAFPLLLFAYPRFDFFHLIPAVAVLALVMGTNLAKLFSYRKIWSFPATISIISMIILLVLTARYFSRNWTMEIRFFENDIHETAYLIRRITTESENIYIQNGPDQILPLADRLPTKPWADEFPWYLEIDGVQEKVIEGIRRDDPQFVVFKPYEAGPLYQIGAYRPAKVADYLDRNYADFFQISQSLWLKIKR